MTRLIRYTSSLLLCAFALHFLAPLAVAQEDKTVIAIVDFKNTSNNQELNYLEKAIPESIITSMAKSGRLEIVERNRLKDAISEMQLGMSGIVDEQTAIEVGRAVGASAILVGSFVTIGSMIQINARLIDVKTSKIIKADSKRGYVGEEIFRLMDDMARSMEQQMMGEAPRQVAVQQVTRENLQESQAPVESASPIYAKWWFWGIIGLAAAGGVAYAATASGGGSNSSTVTISVPIP